MKTLAQEIEAMLVRMKEMSEQEHSLVSALGDALNRADQRLLDEVRAVTVEHESRRALIFGELQSLACRVGMLPKPSATHYSALEDPHVDLPAYETLNGSQRILGGADWREAVSNIEDGVEIAPRRRSPTH
jgi:hypothetical protein